MAIRAPTVDQVVEVGAQLGMRLNEDQAAQYLQAMQPMLAGYGVVDSMAGAPIDLYIQRGHEMPTNTAIFNVTGHPSLTIPCGLSDGLPVGLMLTGRHFDEATVYRAAHAFEQSVDWKTL